MTTRDPKLPLVLIVLCLGAGVYFSIRLLAPPASAATSQDGQATNQDADDAQTAAAKFYLRKRFGQAAQLSIPAGVAVDRLGNLYIADTGKSRIVIVANFRAVTSVHAASFTGPNLSSETIAAAFGANLATATEAASTIPPPTTLGGSSVRGGAAFTISAPSVDLSGSATGEPSVAFVNWSNDRGCYGFASGANSWSIAAIPLQVGENRLTILAYDSLGRSGGAVIKVIFRPEFLIRTIAGAGDNDPAEGLLAASVKLRNSLSVTFDNSDNLYVSDEKRILKINPSGVITGIFNLLPQNRK